MINEFFSNEVHTCTCGKNYGNKCFLYLHQVTQHSRKLSDFDKLTLVNRLIEDKVFS